MTKLKPKKLADVTTHDLTGITDKLAPSEAEHLHRACKTFFRWCVRRRMLQHSPLEGLELPSKWKPRERVLSDDELRTVWQAADELGGHFGAIVKLLILTGQRRSEIGSLRAEWLSVDNGVSNLCFPSDLTKNRRAHTFPISALAADILRSNITTGTTILFPARVKDTKPFNGWSKAKAQLDARIEKINSDKLSQTPWTLHDLRRTYATNLQRLSIRLEVIEALLNHISGTRAGIVGVYQRHTYASEMREAVETYEVWFRRAILDR